MTRAEARDYGDRDKMALSLVLCALREVGYHLRWIDRTGAAQYRQCMRPITINVGEPVYREFREYARQQGRTMSDLIREAMALHREARMRRRGNVRDLQPLSLGGVIRPSSKKDYLLAEMLDLDILMP